MPWSFVAQCADALPRALRRAAVPALAAMLCAVPEGVAAAPAQSTLEAELAVSARLYKLRAAQVVVFRSGRTLADLAWGNSHPRKELALRTSTALPAGELVRPMVAYAVLRAGLSPDAAVAPLVPADVRAGLPPGLRVEHLLLDTSGAAGAPPGYAPPNETVLALDTYLARHLHFATRPGQRQHDSFANYGLLQLILAGPSASRFEERMQATVFAPLGLSARVLPSAVLPPGSRLATVPRQDGVDAAPGMVRSGRYLFALKDESAVPGAGSLFVSAGNYARFLQHIERDRLGRRLLEPRFALHADLGGRAYGFRVIRGKGDTPRLRLESVIPGSAGATFLFPGRGGAVVLAVPSEPGFVRDMLAKVQSRHFSDLFASDEIVAPKKPEVFPRKPQFVPVDTAPLEEKYEHLVGFYRADTPLPPGKRLLSFLNDTRIVITPKHGLELSGVFQKDAVVELKPLGPDLFLAVGNAPMNGWRVRVERRNGEVTALVTDGMVFRRIPTAFSVWAIILALGLAIVLPFLGGIIYFVQRPGRP